MRRIAETRRQQEEGEEFDESLTDKPQENLSDLDIRRKHQHRSKGRGTTTLYRPLKPIAMKETRCRCRHRRPIVARFQFGKHLSGSLQAVASSRDEVPK
ncbi:unnamed protein product [Linum trigynum]|uniref:Uncharacterized protein n=1 Tax=Linum trigynum TaxID=586398 RepID=A0AAV2F0S9_9ROSI